jgi:hypothetical protein
MCFHLLVAAQPPNFNLINAACLNRTHSILSPPTMNSLHNHRPLEHWTLPAHTHTMVAQRINCATINRFHRQCDHHHRQTEGRKVRDEERGGGVKIGSERGLL